MPDPFVTCIMPTRGREVFLSAAIESFMAQDYEGRELIILDDDDCALADVPESPMVRYYREARRNLGSKRNRCCELAKGEIICHFDDDDWSAPDRIRFQVELLRRSGKPVTGFSLLYFWNTETGTAHQYRTMNKGYVCGTTLCYRKDFWDIHRFKDVNHGEDNDFVYSALSRIEASIDPAHMVARIHGAHTSSKKNIVKGKADTNLLPVGFWANEQSRLARAL